ncbi:unnamed protein product [Soboliphyme baturini]|uniref:Homeobox_KN domain-containing protein n=1 Tax=Soboliphyme baturini TaxID=241478 RepID=A0A183J3E5_9BILA|nr:unnamed protein product [Soboliphyme baturini]
MGDRQVNYSLPFANLHSLSIPLGMNRSGSRDSFLTDMSNVSVASLMSERSALSDLDTDEAQQNDCMYVRFPYDELLKMVKPCGSDDLGDGDADSSGDGLGGGRRSEDCSPGDSGRKSEPKRKLYGHEPLSILLSPNLYRSFSSPELTDESSRGDGTEHRQPPVHNGTHKVTDSPALPLKRCLSDAVLLRRSSNVISQTKFRISPYRNMTPTQVTELKLLVVEALARTGHFPSSPDVARQFGQRTTAQEKSTMVLNWLKTMYDHLNDNLSAFTLHLKNK